MTHRPKQFPTLPRLYKIICSPSSFVTKGRLSFVMCFDFLHGWVDHRLSQADTLAVISAVSQRGGK